MTLKQFLFLLLITLNVFPLAAQGNFLGVPYHHAKAYKLNSGYEPASHANGIPLSGWQAKQLNWIMSSAESYDVSGSVSEDCYLYDKVIFYNETGTEVASLSLGLDCGKFKLTSSAGTRAVANRLNGGGSDAIFELLAEVYVKLSPVLPKNVKTVKHLTEAGDTWASLAEKYNTTAELLCAVNKKMLHEKIRTGITLKAYPGVKYYAYPGTKPVVLPPSSGTAASAKTHTVAAKETLYSISKKYGVPVASIQKANNLADNAIKIGQVLKIPAK